MEFSYTVATSLDVQEAAAKVTGYLKEAGFGVLWSLDVQEKLKEKGVTLERPVRILEVCNPQKAKEALDEEIQISFFLPCKVVIYADGEKTTAGYIRPGLFAGFFPHSKVFPDLAAEVDSIMKGVLDRLPE